jgi:hypothetical protein
VSSSVCFCPKYLELNLMAASAESYCSYSGVNSFITIARALASASTAAAEITEVYFAKESAKE